MKKFTEILNNSFVLVAKNYKIGYKVKTAFLIVHI